MIGRDRVALANFRSVFTASERRFPFADCQVLVPTHSPTLAQG
jgi:hypothetical protein